MSSVTTSASKKSLFNGRKMWFVLSAAAAVFTAIFAFTLVSVATAKETYFVLGSDVPARTLITPDLLVEVSTSAGTAPKSLGLSDLTEDTYSLYALSVGDILTGSNTGSMLSLNEGLPSDYVVASFVANPSMAAGGNVKRGDYIDIIGLASDTNATGVQGEAASYLLQRVLVIDATVDLDSYDGGDSDSTVGGPVGGDGAVSSNTSGAALRSGVPTLFTVGLSQQNAAVLALATRFDLFVVLSSAQSANEGIVGDGLEPVSGAGVWGGAFNAGEGTDKTFGLGNVNGDGVTKPGSGGDAPSKPGGNVSTPSTPPVNNSGDGGEPVPDGTVED